MSTNSLPTATIFAGEVMRKLEIASAAVSPYFNQEGVDVMTAEPGATLSIPIGASYTADALTTTAAMTTDDYTTTSVSLTLDAKQKVFPISQMEMDNCKAELFASSRFDAATSIFNWVEGTKIADFLNLNVRQVAGDATASADTLTKIGVGQSALDDLYVPQMDRTVVLSSTNFHNLLSNSTVFGANYRGDNSTIARGVIGEPLGMRIVNGIYASKVIVNPNFGTSAKSVKTTVAAGGTSVIIQGLTASQTPVFKAGTVISITAAGTGVAANYVIQADANSNSSGEATVTISPALEVQATASDVVTVLTGASAATYTKNYIFHRDFAMVGSRAVVMPDGDFAVARTPQGWILSTAAQKQSSSWQRWNLGASTLYGLARMHTDYGTVLLSS